MLDLRAEVELLNTLLSPLKKAFVIIIDKMLHVSHTNAQLPYYVLFLLFALNVSNSHFLKELIAMAKKWLDNQKHDLSKVVQVKFRYFTIKEEEEEFILGFYLC